MVYTPHSPVKPEKIVGAVAGLLAEELVLPNLMTKKAIDQFKGAANDTLSFVVPGRLVAHEYGWRNDRTDPIQVDEYSERKITVTFGGNFYSAVRVTDEQRDFDFQSGWGPLLEQQARAVGVKLNRRAAQTVEDAPYAVTIGGAEAALRSAIIEARKVLNRFRVPAEQRLLIVGSDFESALLNEKTLTFANFAGDKQAEGALHDATLGNLLGFRVVVDTTIDPGSAYAAVGSAFAFLTGAPSAPADKPSATVSHEGIAMRWLQDYDPSYLWDRSVVNTYAGFSHVTDIFEDWDPASPEKQVVGTSEHFVRGIKLTLDGESEYPATGSALAKSTKVSEANAWTAPVEEAPADPEA